MALHDREFDLVVWGATGFTGRLVAEYLLRRYGTDGLRWALGGRNREKLEAVRDAIARETGVAAASLPLVLGDGDDPASLSALAGRARVVCTTVGPYAKYGSKLVAACAAAGDALLRPHRRGALDPPHARPAPGRGRGERRAHRVHLRLRLDPVGPRRLLRPARDARAPRRRLLAREVPRRGLQRRRERRHHREHAEHDGGGGARIPT